MIVHKEMDAKNQKRFTKTILLQQKRKYQRRMLREEDQQLGASKGFLSDGYLFQVLQQAAHHSGVHTQVARHVENSAHVLAQRALGVQALLEVLAVLQGLGDRVLGRHAVVQHAEHSAIPEMSISARKEKTNEMLIENSNIHIRCA